MGGAVLPYIAGKITDATGSFGYAFAVPVIGYAGILIFAVAAARAKSVDHQQVVIAGGH